MIDHGVCEEFCVLAASGHLADADREALASHCLQCRSCREHLSELAFIGEQLLIHGKPSFRMPKGSQDRFRARALREGIAMRQPVVGAWMPYALCSALVIAMLCFIARSILPHPVAQASVQSAMSAVVAMERDKPREAAVRPRMLRALTKRRVRTLQTRPWPVQNAMFPKTFALRYPLKAQGETGTLVFDVSYPTLSGMEMKRLDLFRGVKEPTPREPFGVAALECPSTISAMRCSFDFSDNIRQLRFQIPNVH